MVRDLVRADMAIIIAVPRQHPSNRAANLADPQAAIAIEVDDRKHRTSLV